MTPHPRYALLLFWPALAVWTWLLLKPNPVPELIGQWDDFLKFLLAKTLHAGVYAALTVLAAVGTAARRRRWMILLMIAHGILSELGQYLGNEWYDTKRSGCVRDVLIDWAGVTAGYGLWRLVRRIWPGIELSEKVEEKKTDRESWSEQAG